MANIFLTKQLCWIFLALKGNAISTYYIIFKELLHSTKETVKY